MVYRSSQTESGLAFERTATQILEGPIIAGLTAMIETTGRGVELADTPQRVYRAFMEMTRGYYHDPEEILSTRFRVDCDEIIAVRNVDFVSLCEHHLLPFTGTAHFAYLPNGQVVGLSKIPRLVDCFARRLQLQERMCAEIAETFNQIVKPQAVGVVIQASHSCLTCRGAQKQRAEMITSTMLGRFREDAPARAELLSLIGV